MNKAWYGFLLLLLLLSISQVEASYDMKATFKTQAHLINFNPEQEEKLQQATEIIRKVVSSREFREAVINHKWKGQKKFVDNKGLSNEQIYTLILDAAESYQPERNNSLDVELELYHENNKTIGYTYPTVKRIWMNKKYFDKYTPIQVADNLFHEWLHKLGFDHSASWSMDRDYTVPYALGYLIEHLASGSLGKI